MNHRTRRAINQFAYTVEGASEQLVRWLRSKAERKVRPRPLVFPTRFQLMMTDMLDEAARREVLRILRPPSILDEMPLGGMLKVRYPLYDDQFYLEP